MARKVQVEEPEVWVDYIRLDQLQEADVNPKEHDIGAATNAIARFGLVVPGSIDEATGKMVAGHGRRTVLERLMKAKKDPPPTVRIDPADGMWMMPILRGVSFANDDEALAYLIADNSLTQAGGWLEAELYQSLARLAATDMDLVAASGFLDYLPGLTPLDMVLDEIPRSTSHNIVIMCREEHANDARRAFSALATSHPQWEMVVS